MEAICHQQLCCLPCLATFNCHPPLLGQSELWVSPGDYPRNRWARANLIQESAAGQKTILVGEEAHIVGPSAIDWGISVGGKLLLRGGFLDYGLTIYLLGAQG